METLKRSWKKIVATLLMIAALLVGAVTVPTLFPPTRKTGAAGVFGYDVAGASEDYLSIRGTGGSSFICGSKFTSPASAASIWNITGYIHNTDTAARNVVYGWYTDNAGAVGTLINQTTATTIAGSTTAWLTENFSTVNTMNVSTAYWLVASADRRSTGTPIYYVYLKYGAGSASQGETFAWTYSSTLPSTFTADAYNTHKFSIFCNYTTADTSANTVTLNTPESGAYNYTGTQINFTYTPQMFQDINNSLLTIWFSNQSLYCTIQNTTTIINNTANGIAFTFSSNAEYLWNVGVSNSTAVQYAATNYTLSIPNGPTTNIVLTDPTFGFAGSQLYFKVNWTAPTSYSLDRYQLFTNNTGSWVGGTVGTFISNTWSNDSVIVNSDGNSVGWYYVANASNYGITTMTVQIVSVWPSFPIAASHAVGHSTGGGNGFYYNGSHAVVYFAYQNTSTNPWHYSISAYDINYSTWYTYDTTIAASPINAGDGHFAPEVVAFPNRTLVMMWAYLANTFQYVISTYRTNETINTLQIISNWGAIQYVNFSASVLLSYPTPIWYSDKVVIFFRNGESDYGNESMAIMQNDAWSSLTTVSYAGKDYSDLYWSFAYNAAGLIVGAARGYNFTTMSANFSGNMNAFFIFSNDTGTTWRCYNGTALTVPFDGSTTKIANLSANVFVQSPSWDENGSIIVPYDRYTDIYTGMFGDKYKMGLLVYNGTLGYANGGWTDYNCTDATTGNQIVGWHGGLTSRVILDGYYGRPAFWAAYNGSENYYIRVPNSTTSFYPVIKDTSYDFEYCVSTIMKMSTVLPSRTYAYIVNQYALLCGNGTANSYLNSVVGNVTFNDYQASDWVTEANAYDGNTATYTSYAISGTDYTPYLVLNLTTAAYGRNIAFWVNCGDASGTMTIDVVYGETGSWVNVFPSAVPTKAHYVNATFTAIQYTAVRFRFYGSGSPTCYVYESNAFNETVHSLFDYSTNSEMWGTLYTASHTGTLAAADVFSNSTWTGLRYQVAVYYANNTGTYSSLNWTLLTTSWANASFASGAYPTEFTWGLPISFPSEYQVYAGVNYYVCVHFEGSGAVSVPNIVYADSSTVNQCFNATFGDSFPSTLSPSQWFNRSMAVAVYSSDWTIRGWLYNYTDLTSDWNGLDPYTTDIGHSLGEVNASLNYNGIQWSALAIAYTNGTQVGMIYGHTGDLTYNVISGCKIWIWCIAAGQWEHHY